MVSSYQLVFTSEHLSSEISWVEAPGCDAGLTGAPLRETCDILFVFLGSVSNHVAEPYSPRSEVDGYRFPQIILAGTTTLPGTVAV